MKSPFPKCPVCHRKHHPRFTTLASDPSSHWTPHSKMSFSRSDHLLRFCSFNPSKPDPSHLFLADKIRKLQALADHPSTPPDEAIAARLAIKRLKS